MIRKRVFLTHKIEFVVVTRKKRFSSLFLLSMRVGIFIFLFFSEKMGSDPIHRDVLKIIKLFAQNLRRHFFVRKIERYYTVRLAHVFGCYKLALAVRDNARLHHDFLL